MSNAAFVPATLEALGRLSCLLAPLGRATLFGGLLAGLVWGLARKARRLPAGLLAAIWWVVGFQFLLALAWREPIVLPLLPARAERATPSPVLSVSPETRVSAVEPAATSQEPRGTATDPSGPPTVRSSSGFDTRPLASALVIVWLLGCLAQGPRTWRSLAAAWRLRRSARPVDDPELLARAGSIAARLGLHKAPPIAFSAEVRVPQIMGLMRPVVLLPEGLAGSDLELVLGHELAHLVRRDLWLGLVPALAERLFFFHPLARLAAREYALACEAACDARMLAALEAPAARYGHLLLRFGVVPRQAAFAATGASPTYLHLKRRLLMLQNSAPAGRRALPWLALLAAVGLVAASPFRLIAKPRPQDAEPRTDGAVVAETRTVSTNEGSTTQYSYSYSYASNDRTAPPPPPAPPALPAPPAPPAPPKPPKDSRHASIWSSDDDGNSYVVLSGENSSMSGSPRDLGRAESYRKGGGDLIWFERNGQEYVIRDAALVKAAQDAFQPVSDLGEKQGALGAEQGKLGAKQGEMGAKQGELGAKMGALAARQGALRRDDDEGSDALEEQMEELGRQQEELGRKQDELGRQQDALGKKQDELGRKQEEASKTAERQLQKLMDEAIASGKAEKVH